MGGTLAFGLVTGAMLLSCGDGDRPATRTSSLPAEARLDLISSRKTGEPAPGLEDMRGERKRIQSGSVELEVANVEEAADHVRRIAAQHQGLIAAAETYRDREGHVQASLTLHVDADRFEDVFTALKAAGELVRERRDTSDITKAYFDLETRLRVKRETESRLRDLLRAAAGKLSEVLEVERELDRIVTQIEELEGEKRYYDQQVARSAIEVVLSEPSAMFERGAFRKVGDAMRNAIEVLSTSLAALVTAVAFLAPWLIVASLIYGVARALRGRRAKRAGTG
jgi:hypothetical protein